MRRTSALRLSRVERLNVLIFQNGLDAISAGQRDHTTDSSFDRDGAYRVRMFGHPAPIVSLQNLIDLGQCGFGRLADLLGGSLPIGARGTSAAGAATAITVGAQHHY